MSATPTPGTTPGSTLDRVFMVMASYNDDAEIMVDSLHVAEATADERAKELNAPPQTWPRWCVVEWPLTSPIAAPRETT